MLNISYHIYTSLRLSILLRINVVKKLILDVYKKLEKVNEADRATGN